MTFTNTIVNLIKSFLVSFVGIIGSIVGYIPALIYSYVLSNYFTKATYRRIAERNAEKPAKNVLDIGTATGQPLYSIIQSFKDAEVLAIDINKSYIEACKRLFKNKKNVTAQFMDFYDMNHAYPEKAFDVIIFGASFMLMPDQTKALEIAKSRLTKDGRIYFLLTLYEQRTSFNKFMEVMKPLIKYLTTVDFGNVTYKTDFENFLRENNMKANIKERCSGNIYLKFFKFYMYEVVTIK